MRFRGETQIGIIARLTMMMKPVSESRIKAIAAVLNRAAAESEDDSDWYVELVRSVHDGLSKVDRDRVREQLKIFQEG